MPMPVITAYHAREGHGEQLKALLNAQWHTLHKEGFSTAQPAFLMQDPEDPNRFIEVFEWKDGTGPDQAWEHPRISDLWHEIRSHCREPIRARYYRAVTRLHPDEI